MHRKKTLLQCFECWLKKNLNTKSSQKVQVIIFLNINVSIQCKIANIKSSLLNNNNGIFHQTKVKQHVYNMGYKNQSMK